MSHPIKDILIQAGYKLLDNGDYWRCTALYRNGKGRTSLSINKKTGYFKDFGGQGLSGPPKDLIKLITGQEIDFQHRTPEPEAEKLKATKTYPKEMLKCRVPYFDFYLKRGISKKTLETFECGLDHSGKLNKRLSFPIYDKYNRIIGFAGRWHQEAPPGQAPKWKLLGAGGKKRWIWPAHLYKTEPGQDIIITEGVSDVLKLHEAGIKNSYCIWGKDISSYMIAYLCGIQPSRIFISTNNDEVGSAAAFKIKEKLLKFFERDKVIIKLPKAGFKDFCEMNCNEIRDFWADLV